MAGASEQTPGQLVQRTISKQPKVLFKLTFHSPEMEARMRDNPYDDGLMGEKLGRFCEKKTSNYPTFAAALEAGWATVQKYFENVCQVSKPIASMMQELK